MVQPFDYRLNVASPFESLAQGYQLGAGIAQNRQAAQARELAMQKERQEMERQAMLSQEVQAFLGAPSASGVMRLSALMPPEQAKSVREGYAALGEEGQRASLSFAGQVLSAFQSGANDVGLALLRERAEGARNAGDQQNAQAFDTWAKIAEANPQMATASIASMVGLLPGGDKVLDGVFKAQTAPAAADKARAEAIIATEEAKVAPRTFDAALKKADADAREAEARIKKLEAEAKRLEATGGVDPDKAFDMEQKLRGEYFKNSAVFRDVRDAYQRVSASQDNAVGDLSLIFGYMKMLDPGSVVREGEFANASNAAGVDDRVRNIYNRLLNGERLTPGQRSAFKGQANALFKTAKSADDKVRSGLTRIAGSYGVRPENIFIESNEAVGGAAPSALEIDDLVSKYLPRAQ